ncbi:isopentenyl-diphosphate Delta-isomerase, partial [Musa troglodytarum]
MGQNRSIRVSLIGLVSDPNREIRTRIGFESGTDPVNFTGHLMENIESRKVLHRAFSVFLFNSKYELLLQQRSATKVTFPLVWTNTCCSHPLYRESELVEGNFLGVRNAAQRKLFDELGIPAEALPVDRFTPLGRMLYKAPSDGKWGEHELDYLLFVVADVKLLPNPDEVADVRYVNREQLKELLEKADAGEEGVKLSPWFRLVVDNFLLKWWDCVESGTLPEVADMKTIHKLGGGGEDEDEEDEEERSGGRREGGGGGGVGGVGGRGEEEKEHRAHRQLEAVGGGEQHQANENQSIGRELEKE